MSADGQVHPESDAWVASVHASEHTDESLGSGVVLDDRRILTCAHVAGLRDDDRVWVEKAPRVWVAFPKAEEGDSDRRLPVERIVFPAGGARVKDLAVLYLAEPVPRGVTAAPLRCPRPGDLVEKRWWAFGFPDGDPIGDSADGRVGAALGHGWVRLDTDSRYPVQPGFSGGGLWSPDYQAVVAVVGHARGDRGDGRAITLHQAGEWFPEEKIRALAERWFPPQAGEVAMSAWGWSLSDDREGPRHWQPRARGVSIDGERGYRFRGRTTALETIRDWLDRDEADRRVLVVTGAPGAGKSAVLGRIVTTADAGAAQQLPASDTGVRARIGSVDCAVHAKGKTALEVAVEIARAASAALPERIEEFASVLRDTLGEQGRRFNVIIDALDEAASPAEARALVTKVIVPVAETCADVGAQVVVGSRRADGDGDLVSAFSSTARLVDLDDAEYFAEEDLAAYALATLQLTGDERPGNPYADDAVAGRVAERIAELSEGNFLVAGLTARTRGLYDETSADPAVLSFSPKVDDAMRDYLRRIPPLRTSAETPDAIVQRSVSAEALLAALAFAEAPGLPVGLWRTALRALGEGDVPEAVLTRFAQSSAASFLVESSSDDGRGAAFRLFHQALNDVLLRARSEIAERGDDERALSRAFLKYGQDAGWERAPAYLLRSMPAHAGRGRVVDDLLADDTYLLRADLRRVLQVTDRAVSPAAQDRARLLGHTPEAVAAGPDDRMAMFTVTEALDGLGNAYRENARSVPYRAQWAAAAPSRENLTLRGHTGCVDAMCAVPAGDRTLLATGGDDGLVQLWDPVDGSQVSTLGSHRGGVGAMCAVPAGDRTLLATGGGWDHGVWLWDPVDGSLVGILEGHRGRMSAMCAVPVGDRTLLATGSSDGSVRLWEREGYPARTLGGHRGGVLAMCAVPARDHTLLATAGDDGLVRLWDLADGSQVRVLEGHRGRMSAMCAVPVGDRTLLATDGGWGQGVWLWDPADGSQVRTLGGHQGWVNETRAMCAVPTEDRMLLAAGSNGGLVRLWDPADGSQVRVLEGHQGQVNAMCAMPIGTQSLLATAGADKTARLWDLRTVPTGTDMHGHQGEMEAVCAVPVGDRMLLAAGSSGGLVRLWDPVDGSQVRTLEGHQEWVEAMCPVPAGDRTLLAVAGADGTVRLWDPVDGSRVRVLEGHGMLVKAMCAVLAGDRTVLATGGSSDGSVQLWNPVDKSQVRTLKGHQDWVDAVCAVSVGDRMLLATGGWDQTVRLWDPVDGSQVRTLEGHRGRVSAMCAVPVGDRMLLAVAVVDGSVRLWDPVDGSQVRTLEGHRGRVSAMCVVPVGDRMLLATGSSDGSVRLWDPADGRCALTVPVHHAVTAATAMDDSLAIALTAGIIAIKFGLNAIAEPLSI